MKMPDYMLVRGYIYDLISKQQGDSLQIPSENELCQLFGVSRITVRGAIKGLVKDKILFSKRGLGTFINPGKLDTSLLRMPIIGVIQGNGRHVNDVIQPSITESINACGMKMETLFLPDSQSTSHIVEIVKAEMDAIVWLDMYDDSGEEKYREIATALGEAGIPLLAISTNDPDKIPEIDSIFPKSEAKRGRDLADQLYALGHKNLLLIHNYGRDLARPGSTHHAFCERMRELCGPDTPLNEGTCVLTKLLESLRGGGARDFLKPYSVLYVISNTLPYVMKGLEKAGISVPEDISLLVYGKTDPYICKGLKPDFRDTESPIQRQLMEWLLTRVHEPRLTGLFKREIDTELVRGETIKAKTGVVP